MRKFLPDTLIGPALRDDVGAVVPFFRAAPDRLYLREQHTGRTIFHLACLSPKAALLRELVESVVTDKQPYSMDEVDYDGCHACHLCARQGHLEHLDILVRAHTSPSDGQPTFPYPLVDHHGRSVSNYTKDPVEWTGYGAAFAEAFTRPAAAITPNQLTVDDIVTIMSLKKSFASTPLPWLSLPATAELASTSTVPLSLGSPHSIVAPSRSSSPVVSKLAGGAPRTRGVLLDASVRSTGGGGGALQLAVFDVEAPPSLVVPSSVEQQGHEGLPMLGDPRPILVPQAPALLSASMLGQSMRPAQEPEAFATLLVTKDPVYVAEMILIKKEIQFESDIFYHDTDISGAVTLRGVAMQVDYYRPTRDPDVVLAAWRCVANPEVVLYICRRVVKPPVESTTRKQKLKRVLNALEASMEIFSKVNYNPRSSPRHQQLRGGPTAAAANLEASLRGYTAAPAAAAAGVGMSSPATLGLDVADGASRHDSDAPSGGDVRDTTAEVAASPPAVVISDDDEDLIQYSVTEAADMILITLRQRLWGLLRTSVRDAIKKIYIVKRFVRRVVNLRSRCANLFFAKLLPVLDAVRNLLATKKRILIQEQLVSESRYLALNIPNTAVHACVRRCAKRKDHRWSVHAHDVFIMIAPLVVGAPDIQATLVRLLNDEWLVPTSERERLSALSVATGSPTKSQRSQLSPKKRATAALRRKRDANDVIRCTPHSPIPYLVGSGADLRAMLLQPK